MIKEFRNQIVHSTRTEIKYQMEFEDKFRIIEDAVNTLFGGNNLTKPRRKWRRILHRIRTDDINLVEPQTRGFAAQAAMVKKMEMNLANRNHIKGENVAVQ